MAFHYHLDTDKNSDNSPEIIMRSENLVVSFSGISVVKGITLPFFKNTITAIIGPSGCGKSTYLRCFNRIHEELDGAGQQGKIFFKNQNIFDDALSLIELRKKVGMVFQKPTPFPGMSILENIIVGPRLQGITKKSLLLDLAEDCLKKSFLWDEVKDKLNALATTLSGGQAQRLCIARALSVGPEVLLMDEPTSALDPIATKKVEGLMESLKKNYTIILVTHDMAQAANVSDTTCFFMKGELIESGESSVFFTSPKNKITEDYISGRIGDGEE